MDQGMIAALERAIDRAIDADNEARVKELEAKLAVLTGPPTKPVAVTDNVVPIRARRAR